VDDSSEVGLGGFFRAFEKLEEHIDPAERCEFLSNAFIGLRSISVIRVFAMNRAVRPGTLPQAGSSTPEDVSLALFLSSV
jgi:hypothetical protein